MKGLFIVVVVIAVSLGWAVGTVEAQTPQPTTPPQQTATTGPQQQSTVYTDFYTPNAPRFPATGNFGDKGERDFPWKVALLGIGLIVGTCAAASLRRRS